jgi:hypothetical protein
MNRSLSSAWVTGFAGFALLLPATVGLRWGTLPTLTVIPAFLLADRGLYFLALAVPMFCFFVWHPRLFYGESRVPIRSYVLLIVLILLSIVDFFAEWKLGLEYRGKETTIAFIVINAVFMAFLGIAFLRASKKPTTFPQSLFLHWMLFAWLAFCAFPYLGELP